MDGSEKNNTESSDQDAQNSVTAKVLFQILLRFFDFALKRRQTIFDNQVEIYNEFVRQPHSQTGTLQDLLGELIPLMYPNVYNESYEDSKKYERDWSAFRISALSPSPASQSEPIFSNDTNETIGIQMDIPISNIDTNSLCTHSIEEVVSPDHIQVLLNVHLWFEGVFQITVGIIGIISNLLAIPVLCGRCMKSIFNKLLICLLILHTFYIISSLLTVAIWPPWKINEDDTNPLWSITLFRFVLRPLNHLMLFSSIFITVLMARQRYLAIRHPIEYRNINQNGNQWIPASKNLFGVLIIAGMFTWSIFLETDVDFIQGAPEIIDINSTHFQFFQNNTPKLVLADLRFNLHYVIWWRNFTALIVSLVLPFCLMAYWNWKTVSVIQRRRRLRNRPYRPIGLNLNRRRNSSPSYDEHNGNAMTPETAVINLNNGVVIADSRISSSSNIAKREEARKARILFTIVTFFVVCNLPRVVLNLEELVSISPLYWKSYFSHNQTDMMNEEKSGSWCYSPPFWALVLGSMNKFLLTLNASVCCFVYCVICRTFRAGVSNKFKELIHFMLKSFRYR